MKKPSVSVIIPVYNTEAYLRESLDSVLAQTEKDLEIICVNDGSTDGSGAILEDYSKRDGRIAVIDKGNGGQSSARNAGIGAASGEYVYFLDSDDKIHPDALKTCKRHSGRERLDVLFFDGATIFESEDLVDLLPYMKSYLVKKGSYGGVMAGGDFFCRTIRNEEFRAHISVQFARRSFLEEHGIRFFEGIMYQDADYTLRRMLFAKRIMHIPETLFTRRVRANSAVTTGIGAHRLYSRYHSLKQLLHVFQNYDLTDEQLECAKWLLMKRQGYLAKDCNLVSEEIRQAARDMLSPSEALEFAMLAEPLAAAYTRNGQMKEALREREEQLQSAK